MRLRMGRGIVGGRGRCVFFSILFLCCFVLVFVGLGVWVRELREAGEEWGFGGLKLMMHVDEVEIRRR